MSPQLAPVRCSFCAKPKEDVAKILAGPGIYICNECVDLCVDILGLDALKEPDGDNPQLQPFETLSNEHLLEHLPLIAAVSDQVEENLKGWVSYLRTQRGVTWAAIGGAMGMTRQSAWGRFSGEE